MNITVSTSLSPRVLVVASSPLARAGLASLLGSQGIDVIGQVADDADLVDQLDLYRPDAVVWDVGYDASMYLERLDEARTARLPIVLLMLLPTLDAAVEAAPVLLGHGANAVLLQDSSPYALAAALHAAVSGFVVLHPAVAGAGFAPNDLGGVHAPSDIRYESLTQRESEVLKLIAEGLPNKQIAAVLIISEHTVKFHVNAILTKLGAQSRTEAVVRATRLGYIAL